MQPHGAVNGVAASDAVLFLSSRFGLILESEPIVSEDAFILLWDRQYGVNTGEWNTDHCLAVIRVALQSRRQRDVVL